MEIPFRRKPRFQVNTMSEALLLSAFVVVMMLLMLMGVVFSFGSFG